jgi:hypothetical protein
MPTKIIAFAIAVLMFQCQPKPQENTETVPTEVNPAAEGFDAAGSDAAAIALADEVMLAMGGRQAWDTTKAISWQFFNSRTLFWDKQNKMARIENMRNDLKIIVNLEDKTGKVYKDGAEMTMADSVSFYTEMGYKMWVNDSYWLVMPFKLKDSGVTLTSAGQDTMANGRMADVLKMTFEGVGVTPDNWYKVWVDAESKLVTQWAYYATPDQEQPGFVLPWDQYKPYGNLMLSGNRGERDLPNIKVWSEVPATIFTDFATTF